MDYDALSDEELNEQLAHCEDVGERIRLRSELERRQRESNKVKNRVRKWTRDNWLAVIGILVGAVAIIASVTVPEIRLRIGLDKPQPAPSLQHQPTVLDKPEPAPSGQQQEPDRSQPTVQSTPSETRPKANPKAAPIPAAVPDDKIQQNFATHSNKPSSAKLFVASTGSTPNENAASTDDATKLFVGSVWTGRLPVFVRDTDDTVEVLYQFESDGTVSIRCADAQDKACNSLDLPKAKWSLHGGRLGIVFSSRKGGTGTYINSPPSNGEPIKAEGTVTADRIEGQLQINGNGYGTQYKEWILTKLQAKHQLEGPPATSVEITFKPNPIYTPEARSLKIEGEVLLEVMFGADGQLHVNRVISGLGHGLDEAAIDAANKIRFKPALRNGRPVDSIAVVHVLFQLLYS